MTSRLPAFLALLLMSTSTLAQSDLTLSDILLRVKDAQAQGNELTVLDVLRNLKTQYADQSKSAQRIAGVSFHFDALVGNYREAMRHFAAASAPRYTEALSADDLAKQFPLTTLRPQPALAALDRLTNGAQIVMLNEAHHVPQHRAFALELLRVLWKNGFRYLAAETLSDLDPGLQERGYPIRSSGYYTAEPVFGDLIRTALRLGYRVIAYEGTSFKNAEERERAQAQNIADRIFKNDPQAKVLIYAGYGHINESGALGGTRTLAQRLPEITGLNPLTIDQTMMREQISEEYEHPIYRHVMARSPINQPTIFVDAANQPWTLQVGLRDVTVFHPRSRYVNGRPTWLALEGHRKPYKLPRKICGAAPRCLVKARLAAESAEATAIDALEVTANTPAPTLMLPRGEFVIDTQDAAGRVVATRSIKLR